MDNNPAHFGKEKRPHPAYVSARKGNKLLANDLTHARRTNSGSMTHEIDENPDKRNRNYSDKRKVRVTNSFWQHRRLFGDILNNFRFSRKSRRKIKKINKKCK